MHVKSKRPFDLLKINFLFSLGCRFYSASSTDQNYLVKEAVRKGKGKKHKNSYVQMLVSFKANLSCFQIVSFAENTSAPLSPRARIFQPILLLFFCFLALEFANKTVSLIDFFYSVSNLSGV